MDELNLNNEMEDMEPDLVELVDDDGNVTTLEVVDYFFYQGQEYVILADYDEDAEEVDLEEVNCYVMKVTTFEEDGEEMESFEPIEDADLEERLMAVATTRLNGEEEDEEV